MVVFPYSSTLYQSQSFDKMEFGLNILRLFTQWLFERQTVVSAGMYLV